MNDDCAEMNQVRSKRPHLPEAEKRILLARVLEERARSAQIIAPLSYGQKALWFIYRSAPESAAYHVGSAMRIRSPINVRALRRALQRLTNRHPALRTTFTTRDGEPVQIIPSYHDVAFEVVDVPGATEDRLQEQVRQAHRRPFDLGRETPLRATLFRRSDNDAVFLLTVHHIAYDGWSLWLNQDELQMLYTAEVTGRPILLPPLEYGFIDHIARQNEMLKGPEGETHWRYWRDKLSSGRHLLNLPTDRPRPPVQRYAGASHAFAIDQSLTEQLKRRAGDENVTLFMLLLAAYKVFLHRYTGEDDFVVGSPASGRHHPQVGGVVGYFVNQLALRTDLSGQPTFSQVLARVRSTVLEALEHQDYPFALLVERLQPKRDPSYAPLVQVLFVLHKPRRLAGAPDLTADGEADADLRWAGLHVEPYELPQQEGQFDLELEMIDAGGRLTGIFKYNSDLFKASTIARMADHFRTLLGGIVSQPESPVGKLPLLTPTERRQLTAGPQVLPPADPNLTLVKLFEAQVALTPEADALTLNGASLTYRELNRRANQLARYLRRYGVKPEVRVSLLADRSIELVVGVLGILKAGGVYVPLDPCNPKERLAFIATDAATAVVLTVDRLQEVAPVQAGAAMIRLDTDWPLIARESDNNPNLAADAGSAAYVIYTSGSTGAPKGCLVTHHNVARLFSSTEHWFRFSGQDVWTLFHSFAFDFSVWELWGALLHGGRLVIIPYETSRFPDLFYKLLVEEGVTVLNQTPSAFRQLMQAEERCGASPNLKLRTVIFGGEALEVQSLRPWFDRHGDRSPRLINMYGITETTVHVTYRPLGIADLDGGASVIGGPIPDLELHVLDPYLEPAPIGVAGELHVGGAGLARGYLNRPDLTEARFIAHPFSGRPSERLYKSGDLARRLPDGDIAYLGRLDDQVKIRGFRVELGEIEAALCRHRSIREAVVLACEDGAGDRRLVAYVVTAPEVSLAVPEVRRFLKETLPDYMVPGAFVFLDVLPLTKHGKVDRRALPAPPAERSEAKAVVAPRDSLEQRLTSLWESVLEVHPVGIRDNFFDLGGHSLSALRLMAEIEKEFAVQLPVAALFQSPIIEQLAQALRRQSHLSVSPLVAIRKEGAARPFFCVAGGGGNVIYLAELARQLGSDQPFYGIQYFGLDGESEPDRRVEDMARRNLQAIRSVQERGPFRLGGHCFGGHVAFEMARMLCDEGETVELLAIMDAAAPSALPTAAVAKHDDATWLVAIARAWQEVAGKPLPLDHQDLAGLDEDGQLRRLRDVMVRADLLPADAPLRQLRGLVNVFKANSQARYLPRVVLPIPLILFRAGEAHPDFDYSAAEDAGVPPERSTLGWKAFLQEPVAVHVVPGNHLTMMNAPHVRVLGCHLHSYLTQDQRTPLATAAGSAASMAADRAWAKPETEGRAT